VVAPSKSRPDQSSGDGKRCGAFCKRCGGALEHMYTFQKATDRAPTEIFTFEIFQCVVCKNVVWNSVRSGSKG